MTKEKLYHRTQSTCNACTSCRWNEPDGRSVHLRYYSWCPLVRIVRTKSGFKAVGHFLSGLSGYEGKNDEKSRKSGYSGFPVSGVRIMSGYFDKFLPLPCLRKWSIPNLTDFYIGWRSNVYEINWVLSCFISWVFCVSAKKMSENACFLRHFCSVKK